MAWTPGTGSRLREVLGSGTRAPSFRPTPPPPAGQWGERSAFWYERRHHGKDKANGQEQRGAGRGGREVLQKPEKEGSEEARKTRGIDRGLTPSRPSQPQFQRGSRAAILSLSHRVEGFRVLTMAPTSLPPSLLGSASILWGSPNLTRTYFGEVSLSPRSRSPTS